jgi:uncharacterized membrane protein YkoI
MNAANTIRLGAAAALLLSAVTAARAGEAPPTDGKPVSEILKSVEGQNAGAVTGVEFDDGLWEVEVNKDGKAATLYIDPKTAAVNRRQDDADADDALPPQDGKPLSEIAKSVEDQQAGVITEIEFDDGSWEVEVSKDGKKVKLDVDPRTGKSRAG